MDRLRSFLYRVFGIGSCKFASEGELKSWGEARRFAAVFNSVAKSPFSVGWIVPPEEKKLVSADWFDIAEKSISFVPREPCGANPALAGR